MPWTVGRSSFWLMFSVDRTGETGTSTNEATAEQTVVEL